MKRLAQLTGTAGSTGLAIGNRTLSLDRLPAASRDWLDRLPRTVLVEVELDADRVIELGDVKPHPRVTALRAVQDNRPHLTLAAIRELGLLVEDDLEVRVAEVAAFERRLSSARHLQRQWRRVVGELVVERAVAR